jgi:hypothetical protein
MKSAATSRASTCPKYRAEPEFETAKLIATHRDRHQVIALYIETRAIERLSAFEPL